MSLNVREPLVTRVYRHKRPTVEFFCPLCSTKRTLGYSRNLSIKNYIHIVLISSVLILASYSLMEYRSFFWIFVVWAAYEAVIKLLFRKEILDRWVERYEVGGVCGY